MSKNSTQHTLRVSFLGTVLAFLMLCIFALTASAQVVPARQTSASSPTASVKVSIVKRSSGYNFSKHMVTVTQGETAILCNKTSISQSIVYAGFTIYTIPANTCQSQSVNFSPGSYTVNLQSNPKASLTIIVK